MNFIEVEVNSDNVFELLEDSLAICSKTGDRTSFDNLTDIIMEEDLLNNIYGIKYFLSDYMDSYEPKVKELEEKLHPTVHSFRNHYVGIENPDCIISSFNKSSTLLSKYAEEFPLEAAAKVALKLHEIGNLDKRIRSFQPAAMI